MTSWSELTIILPSPFSGNWQWQWQCNEQQTPQTITGDSRRLPARSLKGSKIMNLSAEPRNNKYYFSVFVNEWRNKWLSHTVNGVELSHPAIDRLLKRNLNMQQYVEETQQCPYFTPRHVTSRQHAPLFRKWPRTTLPFCHRSPSRCTCHPSRCRCTALMTTLSTGGKKATSLH